MSEELNCMNCCIGDFKHNLCDCDNGFCKEFKSIGKEEDFINVVMQRIRPSGEWIKHKDRTVINGEFIDFFPAEYECSNCGLREAHYFINSKPYNYCPNCGAKMDGEREGE